MLNMHISTRLAVWILTIDVLNGLLSWHCPDGWTHFKDSCYMFGHDDLAFSDAVRYCEHYYGGHIVILETAEENAFIKSYMNILKDPKHWIGLTDLIVEHVWEWLPFRITANFTDWYPNEPNAGVGANCAAMRAAFQFQWTAEDCSSKYKTICESLFELGPHFNFLFG